MAKRKTSKWLLIQSTSEEGLVKKAASQMLIRSDRLIIDPALKFCYAAA
jgi:hypothetical protein